MTYFFTHIGVIFFAGLFIAAMAGTWAYVSYRRDMERKEGEPSVSCGMGCAGCAMASSCGNKENRKPDS